MQYASGLYTKCLRRHESWLLKLSVILLHRMTVEASRNSKRPLYAPAASRLLNKRQRAVAQPRQLSGVTLPAMKYPVLPELQHDRLQCASNRVSVQPECAQLGTLGSNQAGALTRGTSPACSHASQVCRCSRYTLEHRRYLHHVKSY